MKKLLDDISEFNENRVELLRSVDKPKVGWVSIYTPEEVLYAAGLIPFRFTGEFTNDYSQAGTLLHRNICSYVLSYLAEGMDNVYDYADGVVVTATCDARRRSYDVWKHFLKPGFIHLLELPRVQSDLSKTFFKSQLKTLIKEIEAFYSVTISERSLQEAIITFNETRELLKTINDSRKNEATPITAKDMINLVKASTSGLRELVNPKLKAISHKLKEVAPQSENIKQRVLISGSYFDHANILDIIEKFDATVVTEDISNGFKYFNGQIDLNSDPLDGITNYYLDKITCARMVDTEARLRYILRLVEEYEVDSIIYFSLKFCDSNLLDFPYFRKKLQEFDIPVLLIEAEQQVTNVENIKTRIQTFLESSAFA